MQNSLKYILTFAFLTLALMTAIGAFIFSADPMCYYNCPKIDLSRSTQNVYYQAAQIIGANPDTEVLILGSSRGETTPPQWVEKYTGLKTINLSKGGAGVLLKIALLRLAISEGLPIKKVIWVADYFELAGDFTDAKVRQTPVLRGQITEELREIHTIAHYLDSLQLLINHNSFEAALREISTPKLAQPFAEKGGGSEFDEIACDSENFAGNIKPEMLPKEVEFSYSSFKKLLQEDLNENFVQFFTNELKQHQNIEFHILIPPFHPDLMGKLRANYPPIEAKHQEWLKILQNQTSPNVFIHPYWSGIPQDNNGVSFWNDGAHPTCHGMIVMLKESLKN